jgi:hypothetical protein
LLKGQHKNQLPAGFWQVGAERHVADNLNRTSNVSLTPTQIIQLNVDDDDVTVITSNTTAAIKTRRNSNNAIPKRSSQHQSMAATARALFGAPGHSNLLKLLHAIMDTGATAIFIMEGTPVENKRIATKPLTINLPDGSKIKSSHCCDVTIPGLPVTLTGHIVPSLSIASLIGVRVLCNAGCKVTFCKEHCDIIYNDKVILQGRKDPTTDLWTIPIRQEAQPPTHTRKATPTHTGKEIAVFAHSISTRANKVKFAHQALCNPTISKLLKATRKGFLKGCPNISEKLILKYLNPIPATAKGHMKRPCQGIRSTTPKIKATPNHDAPPVIQQIPQMSTNGRYQNIIPDNSDASIANVFCFGGFANKRTGVMYNDMTGNFPFVSLDGSVCYLIMYHYESNSILATPITRLTDIIVYEAYKQQFEELEKKGFKVRMNVMDNQVTKHIKKFLTEK